MSDGSTNDLAQRENVSDLLQRSTGVFLSYREYCEHDVTLKPIKQETQQLVLLTFISPTGKTVTQLLKYTV